MFFMDVIDFMATFDIVDQRSTKYNSHTLRSVQDDTWVQENT